MTDHEKRKVQIRITAQGTDWNRVAEILMNAGLSSLSAEKQKMAFLRSYGVAFAYDEEKLIGVGRVLSDGIDQAAIYNIALDEQYRGQEIGRSIIEALISQVPGCTVILYTHPRTIAMYEHMGFRRLKTAMRYVESGDEGAEFMEDHGFLLPEHYRFHDNEYENIPYSPEIRIPLDHV